MKEKLNKLNQSNRMKYTAFFCLVYALPSSSVQERSNDKQQHASIACARASEKEEILASLCLTSPLYKYLIEYIMLKILIDLDMQTCEQ